MINGAIEKARGHPVTTTASIGATLALISALYALDDRYVHADTYKKDQQTAATQIRDSERARLEDEIFRLENTPARTQLDNSLLDRKKRRIQELNLQEQKK